MAVQSFALSNWQFIFQNNNLPQTSYTIGSNNLNQNISFLNLENLLSASNANDFCLFNDLQSYNCRQGPNSDLVILSQTINVSYYIENPLIITLNMAKLSPAISEEFHSVKVNGVDLSYNYQGILNFSNLNFNQNGLGDSNNLISSQITIDYYVYYKGINFSSIKANDLVLFFEITEAL